MKGLSRFLLRVVSYVLVAAAASMITLALWGGRYSKLAELDAVISTKFIGQADMEQARDAAAYAMVNSLGDRWSHYVPKESFDAYKQTLNNTFVGIGITVRQREDGIGHDILEVTPDSPAQQAGILPGDILIEVDGKSVAGTTTDAVGALVRGEVGTQVTILVLRGEEKFMFTPERQEIKVAVASGQMLSGNIGLVRIANFNAGCGEQTIGVIKQLQEQGATAFIFDVRNNPGGYVNEMVKVLDYLLPEGVLFREVDYRGNEGEKTSDASCLEKPMAVLVNGESYSAAEFFAACLKEYDWATTVGEQTCGKGYFQNTIPLSDGSAVNLSVGKYFTPNGVSLTEVGGLKPDVPVAVDEETAAKIYAQTILPEEDPQLQAAVLALTGSVSTTGGSQTP